MITAIIATKNDPLLPSTIVSMTNGGIPAEDIIVINDGGKPIELIQPVKIVNNDNRMGPGAARQRGANLVKDGWLMITDSHMVFPPNWFQIVLTYLHSSSQEEIWGPIYRCDRIFDSMWFDTHLVAGADFYYWRHDRDTARFSFCDLIPRRVKNQWEWEVPCLLGACYFIHSNWFRQMRGLECLVGYGSDETWMMANTWMMGGAVKIMGTLEVTHLYQKATSQRKPLVPEWEANRLAVMKRLLTNAQYDEFLSWLPISDTTKQEVDIRCAWVGPQIEDQSFDHVCQTFGLQRYEEAIGLMKEYHEFLKTDWKKR